MASSSTSFLSLARRLGAGHGITSVCSAHPLVIEAALRLGAKLRQPVLIEATCNQVNHEGGYTGMTPADFRTFVEEIADRLAFDRSALILGGDHLGPNPWRHLPAKDALGRAEVMIDAFARAGFTKIHLDASMSCADDPHALSTGVIARRAARLAEISEAAATVPLAYVIGTEVPTPGGATEAEDLLEVTKPENALETIEQHRIAFAERHLEAVFERSVGLVVQPGVEFSNSDVIVYRPERATKLTTVLKREPQFVFEAHSTDYQPQEALTQLVRDGFAILKVGPGLTFALREAFYGLDLIRAEICGNPRQSGLPEVMDAVMTGDPRYWAPYYHGTEPQKRLQRHFSFSDRIRYYWQTEKAAKAVGALLADPVLQDVPSPLVSQYLGHIHRDGAPREELSATRLAIAAVERVLQIYANACAPGSAS
jgi:D-tagatose-1,6-bisphosphate aldolase subunit GatZ/KbaZ